MLEGVDEVQAVSSCGVQETEGNTTPDNLEPPVIEIGKESEIKTGIHDALKKWSLKDPDVIVSFVSGIKHFESWRKEDHRAALQKGIIKLVNTAETWVITNGLQYGVAKLIGETISSEQRHRESKRKHYDYIKDNCDPRQNKLVLMGIVPAQLLASLDVSKNTQDEFHHRLSVNTSTSLENMQAKMATDLYHTHFLSLKRPYKAASTFRVSVEEELAQEAGVRKSEADDDSNDENVSQRAGPWPRSTIIHQRVPLVAVLVLGGVVELHQVHAYVKAGVPVLVVKGSGFMADILASTIEDCQDRSNENNSSDQNVIKSEISRRVSRWFPNIGETHERITIWDKIFDCVMLGQVNDRKLLSVLDTNEALNNLDDHVSAAIFAGKRERETTNIYQQMRSDLLLTMKFNKPDLADVYVMERDEWRLIKIDDGMFEKALTWNHRESFLERFMEQDFTVHKFLNHTRLLHLFRFAEDAAFFTTVVWEHILGRYADDTIKESFVLTDLNVIVEELTGICGFLNMYDMSRASFGYCNSEVIAERKATNALMVWAVLMDRFEIVKTLWKYCDDPIPLALFLSAMYRGLAEHCFESEDIQKMRDQSKQFSRMAVDVLDLSYKESNARSLDLLNQTFIDFNSKTPLKLAYDSKNRYFLSHESCQKWLTDLWEGGLEITGAWETRIIVIPNHIKLILSAIFLFPILFWIHYPRKHFKKSMSNGSFAPVEQSYSVPDDDVACQDDFHLDRKDAKAASKTLEEMRIWDLCQAGTGSDRVQNRHLNQPKVHSAVLYVQKEISFARKVYYLWSAPMTKFWMFQMSYWIYLVLFSITVMLPTCQSMALDIFVLLWTFSIVIEMVLRTIYQVKKDFPLDIFYRFWEIMGISGFLLLALLLRIIGIYFGLVRPFYSRAVMSVGLLYMYYRLITMFFPMHRTLGPMLYRIKRMLAVDFISFLKLVLPFLLANIFVLQAIMYPDFPFSWDNWRRGFFRAFFTLFATFLDELNYKDTCEKTRVNNASDYCWAGDYENYECPTIGWISYLLNIQYLVILKLILVTLLYALFSGTLMLVKEEADYIWKFQRYGIVLDFQSRTALPPPFSLITYMFTWCRNSCRRIILADRRTPDRTSKHESLILNKLKPSSDIPSYSYWMGLTKEYYRKKAQEEKNKRIAQEQLTIAKRTAEEQDLMRGIVKRLNDRLKDLEKSTDHNRCYLEEIKHDLERSGGTTETPISMFILSRKSPYPGTTLKRFHVFDNRVSWEMPYDLYDPTDYSKSKTQYPSTEQLYVDPKVSSKISRDTDPDADIFEGDDDNVLSMPTDGDLVFCWNEKATVAGVVIDRESWIMNPETSSTQYSWNNLGLPRNPIGRTGMTGRGALHRFGPNHCVLLVLTKISNYDLLVLARKDSSKPFVSQFPSARILDGNESPYTAACKQLKKLFPVDDGFDETDSEVESIGNVASMKRVMEIVILPSMKESARSNDESPLEVTKVYQGFLDSSYNTDNAWLEVLVWHVQLLPQIEVPVQTQQNWVWKVLDKLPHTLPYENVFIKDILSQRSFSQT